MAWSFDRFGETPAPPDPVAVRDEYVLETGRLIRRRLGLTILLFLTFVGVAVWFEWSSHPERIAALRVVYALEAAVCLGGLLAAHLPRFRRRVAAVGAATSCGLSFLLSGYNLSVGLSSETLAIAQVCLMTGLAALLPWGWRGQLPVSLAAFGSFCLVQLWRPASAEPYPWIAVLTGATTSMWGAFFLDRYRFEAFARAAELVHASAVKQEEAEISTALTHVGTTLSAGMGRHDLFSSVNRLSVAFLECDWSTTFVFDEQRDAFRFRANVGSRPEVVTELAAIEFPHDGLPLFAQFRRGQTVEIADSSNTPYVPAELGRRWHVASALYAPIWRGEHLAGVLTSGYETRRGPFTRRQHRLALGIANAAAIALENERLVDDLQAANRLKSEFVSTMSHELRTPLNVITGYTEMLADGDPGPLTDEQRDLLYRIERNAEALLELINSTLDLGRLEAGREVVTVEPVDVDRIFVQLADEVEPLAQANEVDVRWRAESTAAVDVSTDRTKLKTIVKNLVVNAIKFTPGGSVDITAHVLDDALQVEVRDTGVGIAPEDIPKIFDMFRQLDPSPNRGAGGVGLGLHIAKRLAERLGGSVAVRSQKGVGSTFTLRLPVRLAVRELARLN